MAIKAHLDQSETGGDRRMPRRQLRLETSGLASGGTEANVIIHNISASGLLIETRLELTEAEQLAVDLPEAGIVTATIVWRSDRLYGCAFGSEIGAAALAAAQLQGVAAQSPPAALSHAPSALSPTEPLGVRINRLRRDAGLTLADVANALGVSKPTVWAWEKGKARPIPERLDAIAEALGVSSEELAQAAEAKGRAQVVIDECRHRIAEACGTTPEAVRIMIEL